MNTQQPRPITVPDEITSSDGKLVYVYVHLHDGVDINELHSCLGLSRLTIIGLIEILSDYGVISRDGDMVVPT